MASVRVTLSRAYSETGAVVAELCFRSPRWSDYIELGDIDEWQPIGTEADGSPRMILVRGHDKVASYAERCLEAPRSAADLALLDLVDVLKVHEAIRGFFAAARTSQPPPISSSGGSEKALPTSDN